MSLSLGQLLGMLEVGRDRAEEIRQEAVDEVGDQAVDMIRDRWPRRSGLSGDSFEYNPSAIENDVEYTSEVHDGLVFRLVPEVLEELQPTFEDEIERRLTAALEG